MSETDRIIKSIYQMTLHMAADEADRVMARDFTEEQRLQYLKSQQRSETAKAILEMLDYCPPPLPPDLEDVATSGVSTAK